MQVAFLTSDSSQPIFYVDRVVDFLFLIDILVNCNLVFYDESKHRFVQERLPILRRCALRLSQHSARNILEGGYDLC
jgi:hypothetical protein